MYSCKLYNLINQYHPDKFYKEETGTIKNEKQRLNSLSIRGALFQGVSETFDLLVKDHLVDGISSVRALAVLSECLGQGEPVFQPQLPLLR